MIQSFVCSVFVLFYTFLGGFLAESASDFMQAVVMIIALIGGVASGFVMKLDFFGKAEKDFSDQEFFADGTQP